MGSFERGQKEQRALAEQLEAMKLEEEERREQQLNSYRTELKRQIEYKRGQEAAAKMAHPRQPVPFDLKHLPATDKNWRPTNSAAVDGRLHWVLKCTRNTTRWSDAWLIMRARYIRSRWPLRLSATARSWRSARPNAVAMLKSPRPNTSRRSQMLSVSVSWRQRNSSC